MSSFTWQDVFNHLQSCSPDELNREVQVNGEYQPVPVLEY